MHPENTVFGKPKEAVGRWLLPGGPEPEPASRHGESPAFTPIHELVLDGGSKEQALVAELCRIDREEGHARLMQALASEDEGGCTPLMRAAFNGSAHSVRALLAMGADANAISTKTHRTALHEAASGAHDSVSVSGLLLGAGANPETRALLNGRTALDITRLKIGADGHVGSSAITGQLAPLVRENQYRPMNRAGIERYDAEVAALRHVVEIVGLARGLAKHTQLMAAVDELQVDLPAMIRRDGVEAAVATTFEHAEAAARAKADATTPSQSAASLLPGTVIYVAGKGRGVYKGGAQHLSQSERFGSGEFSTDRNARHDVEFASGITQSVQLDQIQWSRVDEIPKRSGPVRRDPLVGNRSPEGMMVSDSLDQFREVHSPRAAPPRQVQMQMTPTTHVYEQR
ncbi:ankyrin repeat domain-containing protein [bacterium]|nr:ankyrin repeat domain-containing protein [bacterium]